MENNIFSDLFYAASGSTLSSFVLNNFMEHSNCLLGNFVKNPYLLEYIVHHSQRTISLKINTARYVAGSLADPMPDKAFKHFLFWSHFSPLFNLMCNNQLLESSILAGNYMMCSILTTTPVTLLQMPYESALVPAKNSIILDKTLYGSPIAQYISSIKLMVDKINWGVLSEISRIATMADINFEHCSRALKNLTQHCADMGVDLSKLTSAQTTKYLCNLGTFYREAASMTAQERLANFIPSPRIGIGYFWNPVGIVYNICEKGGVYHYDVVYINLDQLHQILEKHGGDKLLENVLAVSEGYTPQKK